jgi:hypothetical protein
MILILKTIYMDTFDLIVEYAGLDALFDVFPESTPLGFQPTCGQY